MSIATRVLSGVIMGSMSPVVDNSKHEVWVKLTAELAMMPSGMLINVPSDLDDDDLVTAPEPDVNQLAGYAPRFTWTDDDVDIAQPFTAEKKWWGGGKGDWWDAELRDRDGRWTKEFPKDPAERAKLQESRKAPQLPYSEPSRSKYEQYTVDRYVSPKFNDAMSKALRKDDLSGIRNHYDPDDRRLTGFRDDMKILDNLIHHATLTEDTHLYRGVSISPHRAADFRPGATFSDKSFVSTSSSAHWAKAFSEFRSTGHSPALPVNTSGNGGIPGIMRIHAPAGTHALQVSEGMGEYVLPRGTAFRIDSVDPSGQFFDASIVPDTSAVSKQLRRQVDLNGQETWQDIQDQAPPAAGGGAMQMPPVPGGVPGFTAGAEPPRWDGSSPQPRIMTAPDDGDDGMYPDAGRVRSERPHAAFPTGPQAMDGYWPASQPQPQSPESSPGGKRGVPPSTVGAKPAGGKSQKQVRKQVPEDEAPRDDSLDSTVRPDLAKVGKEGYIHGWVCVRPPCGKVGDEVSHPILGSGIITSSSDDGTMSASFSGVTRILSGRLSGAYNDPHKTDVTAGGMISLKDSDVYDSDPMTRRAAKRLVNKVPSSTENLLSAANLPADRYNEAIANPDEYSYWVDKKYGHVTIARGKPADQRKTESHSPRGKYTVVKEWHSAADGGMDSAIRQESLFQMLFSWSLASKRDVVQEAARREFSLGNSALSSKPITVEDQGSLGTWQSFLRAQHELTQADFAKKGITHVVLHRGFHWMVPPAWASDSSVKEQRTVKSPQFAPLSSWSTSVAYANQFAGSDHTDSSVAVIMSATVPVSQILSYPRSGFGMVRESEMVVIAPAPGTGIVSIQRLSDTPLAEKQADGRNQKRIASVISEDKATPTGSHDTAVEPSVTKVGPEGYIHGWIKVGPGNIDDKFDAGKISGKDIAGPARDVISRLKTNPVTSIPADDYGPAQGYEAVPLIDDAIKHGEAGHYDDMMTQLAAARDSLTRDRLDSDADRINRMIVNTSRIARYNSGQPESLTRLDKNDFSVSNDTREFAKSYQQTAADVAAHLNASDEDLHALAAEDGRHDVDNLSGDELKRAVVDGYLNSWRGSSGGPAQVAMISHVASRLGRSYQLTDDETRTNDYIAARPAVQRAAHAIGDAMYATTQEWLKNNGIKNVEAYRASRGEEWDKTRPWTSWSTMSGWTRESNTGGNRHESIPAERIFSLPPTGFGTYQESEAVVLPLKPGETSVRLSDKTVKEFDTKATLLKVGKEGYIHGYICVRPPCGPQYTEAKFDSKAGAVIHGDTRIGKLYKNKDGTFSVTHLAADGTKTRLGGTYANRGEAAMTVVPYHDLSAMHGEMQPGEARDAVASARDALAAGDVDGATSSLRDAANVARAGGDDGLASHADHIRTGLSGENAVEPKPSDTALTGEIEPSLVEPVKTTLSSPLTSDEEWARSQYTLPNTARRLNASLRNGAPRSDAAQDIMDNLDGAMAKSTTSYDAMVHRAITVEPGKEPRVGDEVIDPGYMSTSASKQWAEDWAKQQGLVPGQAGKNNAVLSMNVPAGTHALPGHGGAGELVLDRGTKYTVTGVHKDDDGQLHVQARVISRAGNSVQVPDSKASKPDASVSVDKRLQDAITGDALQDATYGRAKNLTPAEKNNLDDFYLNGYKQVNSYLRNSAITQGPTAQDARTKISLIDSAFSKTPAFPKDVQLSRGIANANSFFGDVDSHTGKVYSDSGYNSASAFDEVAAGFGRSGEVSSDHAMLHILMPAGTKALDARSVTGNLPEDEDEGEYTIPRGQQYVIEKDELRDQHVPLVGRVPTRHITLRALTPEETNEIKPVQVPGSEIIKPVEPAVKSVAPISADPPHEAVELVNEANRLDHEANTLDKSADPADRERAYYLKYQAGAIRDGNLSMNPGDLGYAPRTIPDVLRESGIDENDFDANMSVRQKAALLASNEEQRATVAAEAGLTPEAADEKMREELRGIASHHIATRVTNPGLEHILDDNAFKTQFETNKSQALKSNHTRAVFERTWFGYPENMDPSLRPVYGYVTDGVDRPAGVGVNDWFGFNTDQLSSFGTTQVVLKDAVKQHATFNVGDSLNNSEASMPSRMLDPDTRSFAAYDKGTPSIIEPGKSTYKHGIMQARGLRGMNRDYTSPNFRQHAYNEVQVHSSDGKARPLTPDDIDHVLFDKKPPQSLTDKLTKRGIPWKVWNAITIAKDPAATSEEKSRALEVTQEDLAHTNDKIAEFHISVATYTGGGGAYVEDQDKKDLQKMTTVQLRLEKGLAALQKAGVKSRETPVQVAGSEVVKPNMPNYDQLGGFKASGT